MGLHVMYKDTDMWVNVVNFFSHANYKNEVAPNELQDNC